MTRNHIIRDKMEDESQEQADAIAELIEERLSLRVSVDGLFWWYRGRAQSITLQISCFFS